MKSKKQILIVEDEKSIVDILSFNLQREGYEILTAYDGTTGLNLALAHSPDLILLDLMLPNMSGFDVCTAIRSQNHLVPIIILSAREEESDKVFGLGAGADDYITKPFSMKELLARVNANIRRTELLTAQFPVSPITGKTYMERGRILIDDNRLIAFKDGITLDLTQREYELLRYLVETPEKVYSREELMANVWNYDGYIGTVRAVDAAICRLREKLEDDPNTPEFILTRRNVGYYFHQE